MKQATIKCDRAPLGIVLLSALLSINAGAQGERAIEASNGRVIGHWTQERRAAAIPRDLVIDTRGLPYLKQRDGRLVPHGHDIVAEVMAINASVTPFAKAGGGTGDTTGPAISNMDPAGGTLGASYLFKATVTDPSGLRSVVFKIQKTGDTTQSLTAIKVAGTDVWSATVSNLTTGNWKWWVEAKDGATKMGNSSTSAPVAFAVDTGSSGGGGNADTIANAQWSAGGAIQTAAGRIYFEMPGNAERTTWSGFVCSGTVATDDTTGRSVILTAAHCVYDDVNKAFARNVMFIPDQAHSSSGTDRDCGNDPLGCWVPALGVVDLNWTTRVFPYNAAWDYAYYVVSDSGAHQGNTALTALDTAAGSLPVSFNSPYVNDGQSGAASPDYTYALGYSYNSDPNFMYCAQDMTMISAVNWWLSSCGLTGGSSGGPWVQPMVNGGGPIISVNSWRYTNTPGMAGPKFVGSSAACVFGQAKSAPLPVVPLTDGNAGVKVSCP